MPLDLLKRYPKATLSLDNLMVRLQGVQGPENDALLAREIACEICDESFWRFHSWWLPARPGIIEGIKTRLNMEIPEEVERHARFIAKCDAAREKANRWRVLPIDRQRADLDKIGVVFKDKQPFNHQVTSIGYVLQLAVAALLLDTGLGKTFIMANVMETLKRTQGKGPFLVVAPKTVLREGWGADIERFTNLKWMDIGDPPPPEPMTVCPTCNRDFKGKPVPKVHLKTHLKKWLQAAEDKVKAEFVKGDNAAQDDEMLKNLITSEQAPIWEKIYNKYPGMRPGGVIERDERVTKALARNDVDVYVINPEQVKFNLPVLMEKRFDLVTVDESSMMRAHESQTTEALIKLGWSAKRRVAMSGTPRPNSSLELWGQFAMLDACFGADFVTFRDKYFQKDFTGYRWNQRPGMDAVFAEMVEQRSLRYRLDDCVDLPGEMTETREVELGPELRKHYREMLEEMIVKLEDETVSTPYKLVQINKLSQITSGFIYDKDGKEHYLGENNPKLIETVGLAQHLITAENRAVVIWIRFSDVEATALKIALGEYGVSAIVGGMSSEAISKNIQDFKSGKNKVMVAHPLSAKFGHTWVHATAAIFHSYDFSWENYHQAKRRIYRIGQDKPVTYINIVARKTVDNVIMKALARKEHESAVVIDRKLISAIKATL